MMPTIPFASELSVVARSLQRRSIAIFRRRETSFRAVRLPQANGRTGAKCRLDGLALELSPGW